MLNSTKSIFPLEAKQRIIEEKLGFVDLLSSNCVLFIRVFAQSGEFLLGSASKKRFNFEDLFEFTASAIIKLLLENVRCDFADISDNTFTKRLIQRCDQHKLFKTLASIFSSASNHAMQVLEERVAKSIEVSWIRFSLDNDLDFAIMPRSRGCWCKKQDPQWGQSLDVRTWQLNA